MASVVAVQRSASSAALVLRSRRPTRALRCSARTMASSALDAVKAQIASAPVVVFSKTYCPYCTAVKGLFNTLNVKATVIELDKLGDGADQQAALIELTNQRTVPNVFIGGKHVGGNDATQALYKAGTLAPLLKAAGAV